MENQRFNLIFDRPTDQKSPDMNVSVGRCKEHTIPFLRAVASEIDLLCISDRLQAGMEGCTIGAHNPAPEATSLQLCESMVGACGSRTS